MAVWIGRCMGGISIPWFQRKIAVAVSWIFWFHFVRWEDVATHCPPFFRGLHHQHWQTGRHSQSSGIWITPTLCDLSMSPPLSSSPSTFRSWSLSQLWLPQDGNEIIKSTHSVLRRHEWAPVSPLNKVTIGLHNKSPSQPLPLLHLFILSKHGRSAFPHPLSSTPLLHLPPPWGPLTATEVGGFPPTSHHHLGAALLCVNCPS